MSIYDYDSNIILPKASTDRRPQNALSLPHHPLLPRGLKPKLQCLDNKVSQKLKDYMRQQHISFQLAPPHIHCHYSAKRAICQARHMHLEESLHCGTSQKGQTIPSTFIGLSHSAGSHNAQPTPTIPTQPSNVGRHTTQHNVQLQLGTNGNPWHQGHISQKSC